MKADVQLHATPGLLPKKEPLYGLGGHQSLSDSGAHAQNAILYAKLFLKKKSN
jgi:hypothetical protein